MSDESKATKLSKLIKEISDLTGWSIMLARDGQALIGVCLGKKDFIKIMSEAEGTVLLKKKDKQLYN